MFDRILQQMQDKMRQRQYVMTLHAEEEMTDDGLSVYDIEAIVDSGTILERQKDQNTKAWKYRVNGRTLEGDAAEIVARLSLTGKIVIITVYLC